MPLNLCFKQLAKLIPGASKPSTQGPRNKDGWSDLPEDIFLLILNDHLDADVSTLKALSQTCRTYASFCRPFLFHTVSIADPKTLERFKRALKRTPSIARMVHTLRITDRSGQLKLHSRRIGSSMTNVGEGLLHILSQDFPRLKVFEFPRLRKHQEWATLPRVLQEGISSFLQRHPLEDVSITTHYPFDLLRNCPGLQRLECRIYAPSTETFTAPLIQDRTPENSAPPTIKELVIQDPSDLASTVTPRLMESGSWISFNKLDKLTYYGDKTPLCQLPSLLAHCAETLSSLQVFVGDSVSGTTIQPLDLTSLTNLHHLTLSHDRVRYGPNSIAWIYGTLGLLLGRDTTPLQTVDMVIRAGNPSWLEMVELSGEWVFMWAVFLVQLRLILSLTAARRLQRMQVSGFLEKGAVQRLFGRTPARFDAHIEDVGQNSLPGSNVEFREDAMPRWVRVPANGNVPLY